MGKSTIKNVSLVPQDLPDGRLLRPGKTADRVDLEEPHVAAMLALGVFVVPVEAAAADGPATSDPVPTPPKPDVDVDVVDEPTATKPELAVDVVDAPKSKPSGRRRTTRPKESQS